MKIHEYQAKEILRRFGVPVPKGKPVLSFNEVEAFAKTLITETENEFVVVKAQIHAGGRGKGGGVKVVKGAAAARETMLPSGPVWYVTRRMPIILAAASRASSALLTTLTPPPLPRPPA